MGVLCDNNPALQKELVPSNEENQRAKSAWIAYAFASVSRASSEQKEERRNGAAYCKEDSRRTNE